MNSPKEKYTNPHDHLSEDQLIRYQEGKMNEAEMHLVERHLLQCSLCNDALEGFFMLESDHINPTIEDLKAQFAQKLKGTKAKSKTAYWKWGVAASLLFLFSASVFFMLNALKNEPQEVVKTAVESETQPKLFQKEEDTNARKPAIALNSQDAKDGQTPKPNRNRKNHIDAKTALPPRSSAIELKKEVMTPNQVVPSKDTSALLLESIEEVTFMENGRMASAYSRDYSTVSGEMQSKRVPFPVKLSVPKQALKTGDTSLHPDNIIESDTKRLSKIMVDYEAQKKEKEAYTIPSNINVAYPAPVKGDRYFKKYIQENRLYPPMAKSKGIEGNVVVEFSVAPDSTLADFKILKSLGYDLDEEAIRLIKEGPTWAPAIINGTAVRQKTVVEVPFLIE